MVPNNWKSHYCYRDMEITRHIHSCARHLFPIFKNGTLRVKSISGKCPMYAGQKVLSLNKTFNDVQAKFYFQLNSKKATLLKAAFLINSSSMDCGLSSVI